MPPTSQPRRLAALTLALVALAGCATARHSGANTRASSPSPLEALDALYADAIRIPGSLRATRVNVLAVRTAKDYCGR